MATEPKGTPIEIKVEVKITPEALRRFLGLPDVSGLQEDIVAFLRDKVGAASEFDASGFVKQNLDALRRSSAWKNIVGKVRVAEAGETAGPGERPRRRRRRERPATPGNGGDAQ